LPRLLIVPLIRPQNNVKLVKDDIAAHSDTILLDQLFKAALVVVENLFFIAHHILEKFVRCRASLTDKIQVIWMFHQTLPHDPEKVSIACALLF